MRYTRSTFVGLEILFVPDPSISINKTHVLALYGDLFHPYMFYFLLSILREYGSTLSLEFAIIVF